MQVRLMADGRHDLHFSTGDKQIQNPHTLAKVLDLRQRAQWP